jgi:hypothetical protein
MEGGDSCLKQNNRIGLLKYLKKKAKFKKKKNLHKIKINSIIQFLPTSVIRPAAIVLLPYLSIKRPSSR